MTKEEKELKDHIKDLLNDWRQILLVFIFLNIFFVLISTYLGWDLVMIVISTISEAPMTLIFSIFLWIFIKKAIIQRFMKE